MHFTGLQLRAARGLLRITAEQLAKMAGVSSVTIRRAELEDGPVGMSAPNVFAVQKALADAGVIFIEAEPGVGGYGVRLKWGGASASINQTHTEKSRQSEDGLSSRAWDDEFFMLPMPADPDLLMLYQYWQARPIEWQCLSEPSRSVVLAEIFGAIPDSDPIGGPQRVY